jgi:transposase-like protein
MTSKRKRHSAEFKAKVALEAAKEVKTLNELGTQYNVHPAQISQWKAKLLDEIATIFLSSSAKNTAEPTKKIDDLHRLIGEVTVERDWLKKKLHL